MQTMIGPTWLATGVGVLMLGGTVYAIVRILAAWRSGKATDYALEVCHAVMGVSMAGMLIPALKIVTPGPSLWIWLTVSALITAWFVVCVIRGLVTSPRKDAKRIARLPHLVLSGAMVYMLAATGVMDATGSMGGSMASMSGMNMASSSTAMVPWASLDLILAFIMIGYTVLVIDRLPSITDRGGIGQPRSLRAAGHAGELYAPKGAAGLVIIMSAGMSYMLVMTFA